MSDEAQLPGELIDRLVASGAQEVYLPPTNNLLQASHVTTAQASREHVRAVAEDYYDDPDRLHGDRLSSTAVTTEKPIHRAWIYMHAQGATPREIASKTNYSYAAVASVLRQPWARQRLVQILKETGQDQVKHFLKAEVGPSLEVLREVRDSEKSKQSEKISAASAILDRALGKPTVHIEADNTNRNVPADLQRLDAEIAGVRKQLEGRGVLDEPVRN
jgi:hypothetical protein